MSVTCPIKFIPWTDAERRPLDFEVMSHVFASHNELGRLCDEDIYKNDVRERLNAASLTAKTEVPVTVAWRGFRKTYFLDLVVGDALLYELKAAAALTGHHKAQLLNYILLLELPSGKLLNFCAPQVESEFVATRLTLEKRRAITFDTSHWQPISDHCPAFRENAEDLIRAVGAFLELDLYAEALAWSCGSALPVRIPLTRDGLALGTQEVRLIAPGTAFHLTAHTENLNRIESHLLRFLRHTSLRGLQWLNFNHATITLTTLLPSA